VVENGFGRSHSSSRSVWEALSPTSIVLDVVASFARDNVLRCKAGTHVEVKLRLNTC
jgi:hypothetical protein